MPHSQEQLPVPGITEAELPPEESAEEPTEAECPTCGHSFPVDEGFTVDGADYCVDCVYHCEECDEAFADEDEVVSARTSGYRRSDTKSLCKSCARECADCNTWYVKDCDGGSNTSDEWVCSSCAENYFYCEGCSSNCHSDDYAEDGYCTSCHTPEDDESIIHDYSYKPAPRFLTASGQKRVPATPYFGIEIEGECERGNDPAEELESAGLEHFDEWYAKHDGSLNHGAELVSHPATWQYWKEYQFGVFDKLRKAGWRSYDTDTCGMHVHISRAAFTKLDEFKLIKFFKRNSELILKLSRRRNSQALSQYARIEDGNDRTIAYKVKKPKWEHSERYAAINLENEHTVEIRIFRGTLSAAGIKRNIAFCFSLVHFVKWAGMQNLTAKHYAAWLRSHGVAIVGKPEGEELLKWITQQIKPDDSGH